MENGMVIIVFSFFYFGLFFLNYVVMEKKNVLIWKYFLESDVYLWRQDVEYSLFFLSLLGGIIVLLWFNSRDKFIVSFDRIKSME